MYTSHKTTDHLEHVQQLKSNLTFWRGRLNLFTEQLNAPDLTISDYTAICSQKHNANSKVRLLKLKIANLNS